MDSILSPSSADNAARNYNIIGVCFFKENVHINYCFNSLEDFHNHLNSNVLAYNLTSTDIIELVERYYVIFSTMRKWMALNVNVFENCTTEVEQDHLLSIIFPTKSSQQIKDDWMYLIANLIFYSQISNDDNYYRGEGYKIDRESSFTMHHLVQERYRALKNVCPFCKVSIFDNSSISVTCDHCPQVYCSDIHKQADKEWPSEFHKPRNIKKNHCCELKNKQMHFIKIIVKNNTSYTEDFPVPTRLPLDDINVSF
jgi:hypothetical protein